MKHIDLLKFLAGGFAAAILVATPSCNSDAKKLKEAEKELEELRQLAELDKREMENQYTQFALQYDELKKSVKDDSLIVRLNNEKKRAEELLKELRQLRNNDVAEIRRLKKELATVRAVLRSYILQVDSLQRLNLALIGERDSARAQLGKAATEITSLSEERANLTEKVAIAAQLNATNISIEPTKKNGKTAKRSKDIANFTVSFDITRNVTATTGERKVYVRLLKPGQTVVNKAGVFAYEDREIEYSAAKAIEYTGQEQNITLYVPVKEYLGAGQYTAYIFVDGQMIGSGSVTLKK
jgi:hypothetical protein